MRESLAQRAETAWRLASAARDTNPNWVRMLEARNWLERLLFDPHPRIRRLALDFLAAENGRKEGA